MQCIGDGDCGDPIRESCDFAAKICVPREQWSVTTVTYASGLQREMSNCYFCDATTFGGAISSYLRFQQGAGSTLWSVNLVGSFAPGGSYAVGAYQSPVFVHLSENAAAVPSALRGVYSSVSGTITFTSASFVPGGVVAGTLSATLQGGNGPTPTTVTLSSTFYAKLAL